MRNKIIQKIFRSQTKKIMDIECNDNQKQYTRLSKSSQEIQQGEKQEHMFSFDKAIYTYVYSQQKAIFTKNWKKNL